jgi:hypothetical protein
MGRSERYQAAKLPRAIMMALAKGVDKALIYRESGADESQHAGSGLFRNDKLSVRPVWYTCATMIRQLHGIHGKAIRLDTSETMRIYAWTRPDGSMLLTAWTSLDHGEPLGLDLGECDITDAFGAQSREILGADYRLSLFPLYITNFGRTDALEAAIAKVIRLQQQ